MQAKIKDNFEKEFNNLMAESVEESKNFMSKPLKSNVINVIKKKN